MHSARHNGTATRGNISELIKGAIEDGDLKKLQRFLTREKINAPLENNWTPLLFACLAGHYDVVCYLLHCGALPNQHSLFFTPLMAVCSSRNLCEDELVKCAQILLENHADVNAMDEHKSTALMIASRTGRKELASFLLNANCNVNQTDNEGMTALHLAVTFNHPQIVRMLLDNGAVKDVKDKRSRTPLNAAIAKGLQDITDMLQDQDLDESLDVAAPQIYVRKKTSFEEMLTQLPSHNDSSGKNGFYKEVEGLLGGVGVEKFVDLFIEKNISLAKLLNCTNKELKDIGVKFSSHRQRVLKGNLRFIQHRWAPGSLPVVNDNVPLSLVDIARSLANTTKHLHILWASCVYCTERVTFESENQQVEDTYDVAITTIKQIEMLMRELEAIHNHASIIEKVDKVSPVDYILPKKSSRSIITVTNVTIITTLIGLLAWKFNFLRILRRIPSKISFLNFLKA